MYSDSAVFIQESAKNQTAAVGGMEFAQVAIILYPRRTSHKQTPGTQNKCRGTRTNTPGEIGIMSAKKGDKRTARNHKRESLT